jgi:hypothetical protein
MLIKKIKNSSASISLSMILSAFLAFGFSAVQAADLSEANVVEYVTFKALEGSDVDEVAKVTVAVNANLEENYPGFVERIISLQEDGTWVEVVYWKDMASAKGALDKFLKDPKNADFLAIVKPDSVSLTYSTLKR